MATLAIEDLPIEYRLTGTRPEPWTPERTMLILEYMAYDLSFSGNEPAYTDLRRDLGAAYDTLYPRVQPYTVPIIGGDGTLGAGDGGARDDGRPTTDGGASTTHNQRPTTNETASARIERGTAATRQLLDGQLGLRGGAAEGFVFGKGSNNWAASGARTASGAPLLAGDMHLTVSLPAIWYEVHLSTPTMNVYGVTIPGTPLPVAAMNDRVAWVFTNTGSDQLDHYRLTLDDARRRYRFDGAWRDLTSARPPRSASTAPTPSPTRSSPATSAR